MHILGRTHDGQLIAIITHDEVGLIGRNKPIKRIDLETLGKDLRHYREELKLSQTDVAKALGMSRNYLSQIENGQAVNISAKFRDAIEAFMGGVEL